MDTYIERMQRACSHSSSDDEGQSRMSPLVYRDSGAFTNAGRLTPSSSWDSTFSTGASSFATGGAFMKNGAVRQGLLSFDIGPSIRIGASDMRYAFSHDSTRLLTYDNGHFRVWKTIDFTEECRLKCNKKKSILNVFFDDQYPSTFTAVLSDSTFISYKIQSPTAAGSIIRQSSYLENVDVKEDREVSPTENEGDGWIAAHRSASFVELGRGSMHGERWNEQIVSLLSERDDRLKDWILPSFLEKYKPWYIRSKSGNLLMVGSSKDDSSNNCTCVHLCSNYQTGARMKWPDRLFGSDATFSDDGRFIVTWDGCTSDSSVKPKSIYVYETSDFGGEAKVTIWKSWRKEGSEESTTRLPPHKYKVPDDKDLLQALLVFDQNSSSRQSSRLENASLLMLCQENCAETAKIFIMSLRTETICYRLDFGESFVQELESPKRLLKGLNDQSPFVLSPNQRWIYLSEHQKKKGTVYSVRDGYPVLEVDWSDDDEFEPLRSKFDPSGRFLVLEDGKRMKVFVMNENRDIVDSEIREIISPDAYAVLKFFAQYDRRKLGKMLSEALSLQEQLRERVTTMLSDGLFSAIRNKIETQIDEHFVDVVVSPDRTLVAFVIDGKTVRIDIFSWQEEGQGSGLLTLKTSVDVPALVLLDAYGDRVGLFTRRGDCREFTYLNPQADDVFVVKMNVDDGSVPQVRELSQKDGMFLDVMKLTADGSKALVVYHNGQFVVLSLEKGVRTWLRGRFSCESGVHVFVDHFLRDAFIHISEDDRLMTVGWDTVGRKPLSIPLDGNTRAIAAVIDKLVRQTTLCNLGNIVWMNRTRTKAIVSATRGDVDSLVIYNITSSHSVEIKRIGTVLPRVASVRAERCLAQSPTLADCRSFEETRSFVSNVVLLWQESLPHCSVLKLFDVELDDDIVLKLIDKFGANLVNTVEGESGSLIHYAVTRGYLGPAKLLFDFAAERCIPVKLSWSKNLDILGMAIDRGAADMVRFVLERLGQRCSTARETARVQKKHLERLLKEHPRLMEDYLKNTTLSIEYGRFIVSQNLFNGPIKSMPIAMTDDRSIEWQASSNEEAREFWKRHHPEVKHHLESSTGTKIEAVAKVVCLEDCVRPDGKRVLEHLISAKLSPAVFTSDTVSTLVQWQWYRFFRFPFLLATFFHLMATALFSIFVLFADRDDDTQGKKIGAVALHLCLLVSLPPATQNVLRSRWMSLLLTMALVLNLWITKTFNDFVATVISFQVIFLWVQVLFYCLPFKMVGPLVSLIGNVLRSIIAFVLLLAIVMTGFALAFLVLFSEKLMIQPADGPVGSTNDHGNSTDEKCDSELDGFQSAGLIFETLFFSTIGNVEADAFRQNYSLLSVWRALLYNGFLFFSTIVLFNLLVSILGDAHERVMYEESHRRIKCRAKIVAKWDAWCRAINRKLEKEGKYFHYLVPAEDKSADDQALWQGRMKEGVKILKEMNEELFSKVMKRMDELEKNMTFLNETKNGTTEV